MLRITVDWNQKKGDWLAEDARPGGRTYFFLRKDHRGGRAYSERLR
jgi:hypothetical protein